MAKNMTSQGIIFECALESIRLLIEKMLRNLANPSIFSTHN